MTESPCNNLLNIGYYNHPSDCHSIPCVKEGRFTIRKEYGFRLLRITSRGTEIYPTMCDFEKRAVDRYRIEIDPKGPLIDEVFNHKRIQTEVFAVQTRLAALGWMISEAMLNRTFIDCEGEHKGKELAGVSKPYGMNLGTRYESE